MNSDTEKPPTNDTCVILQFPATAITPITAEPQAPPVLPPPAVSQSPAPKENPDVANVAEGIGDIFFDPNRAGYHIPNDRGGWVFVNESGAKRVLNLRGYSSRPAPTGLQSPMDRALNTIQCSQDLNFSGSLAGYRVGLHTDGPRRLLVTDEAQIIEPVPGEWPFLRELLSQMFDLGGHPQSNYLFGWLKVAFESLRAGKRRPGQALVFAGPPDSGKSLLQGQIITPILGGREARPYRYMRGGSEFNADLFSAEHLILEDETPSTDLRTRKALGSRIKEITVNASQSCHAKGRNAISLTPFWRITMSVNEEPENLMVLPPMEPSLKDKIVLFKVARPTLPQTNTEAEREFLRMKIAQELPRFLHFLINWQIPSELVSGRFGITHWHHPDILHAVAALSPEIRLLELIDSAKPPLWAPVGEPWRGSAEALERLLTECASTAQRQAEKLFTFPRACATYLGRLAESHSGRVRKVRTSERNLWEISSPQSGEVEADLAVGNGTMSNP